MEIKYLPARGRSGRDYYQKEKDSQSGLHKERFLVRISPGELDRIVFDGELEAMFDVPKRNKRTVAKKRLVVRTGPQTNIHLVKLTPATTGERFNSAKQCFLYLSPDGTSALKREGKIGDYSPHMYETEVYLR